MELLSECRQPEDDSDKTAIFLEVAERLVGIGAQSPHQKQNEWSRVKNELAEVAREYKEGSEGNRAPATNAWTIDPSLISMGKKWKRIARGATSDVYRATYRGFPVAVKVIEAQSLNANARESFIHECELLHRYRHPNLYHFYGAHLVPEQRTAQDEEEDDGLASETFMVFELMRGGSLHDVLHGSSERERRQLSTGEVIRLLYDVACGMAYLHQVCMLFMVKDWLY